MGIACGIRVPSYPYPTRDDEAWAERLTNFPGGGLAQAARRHAEELELAGWRQSRRSETQDEALWEPPLEKRQRRSVEQAGAIVRRVVMALDRRRPPAHTLGDLVGAAVGCVEALGDLLFYATIDEAWANAKRPRRSLPDPLRPRFRGAGDVLAWAAQTVDSHILGCGAQSYTIAESRGRTRATWREVHCAPSHISTGAAKGLHAVELAIDAQRAVAGAGIDPLDLAGLTNWLRDGARPEQRVRRYRQRLALQRGYGVCGVISDATAREATADLCDKAILGRLRQVRERFEHWLYRLPARAEALAIATGDVSVLAPMAAPRRKKAPERQTKSERRPVDRIQLHAPRCL